MQDFAFTFLHFNSHGCPSQVLVAGCNPAGPAGGAKMVPADPPGATNCCYTVTTLVCSSYTAKSIQSKSVVGVPVPPFATFASVMFMIASGMA